MPEAGCFGEVSAFSCCIFQVNTEITTRDSLPQCRLHEMTDHAVVGTLAFIPLSTF